MRLQLSHINKMTADAIAENMGFELKERTHATRGWFMTALLHNGAQVGYISAACGNEPLELVIAHMNRDLLERFHTAFGELAVDYLP